MKKILFITHDTSRTGAPLLLLYFIKWLKANQQEYQLEVLALRGGGLDKDFSSYADHYYRLHDSTEGRGERIFLSMLNKLFPSLKSLFYKDVIDKLSKNKYDLIYCNSVITLETGTYIKAQSSAKLLCHVHELATIIKIYTPNFEKIATHADCFVAASSAVVKMLAQQGVVADKVHLVYEYIEKMSAPSQFLPSTSTGFFTVGGAGTVHWRKGYDIFIQVAKEVLQFNDEIRFKWVGAMNKVHQIIVEEDLRKLGLQNRVLFIGEQEDPIPFFYEFDLFFLSSREDPFPLVCLETGMLGKPIICFDKAGGIPELIQGGGGKVVSYLDITGAANAILHYFKHSEELMEEGKRISEVVKPYTIDKAGPKILSIIQKLI